MLNYIEIEPDVRLKNYIETYWNSFGVIQKIPITYGVFPDGCCDIIINLGDTILSSNKKDRIENFKSYVIGASTQYNEISVSGNINLFGIRFKPLGLKAFFRNTPVGIFKNQLVEDHISFVRILNESLIEKFFLKNTGFANRFENGIFDRTFNYYDVKKHVDSFMLKIIEPGFSTNKTVSTALSIIKQNSGLMCIKDLASFVNTSERNLERLFFDNIGLTPKEYSKMEKLNAIKKRLRKSVKNDLGQIAFDFNYFDQSHFVKDFKTFAGVTPSSF